MPLVSDSGPSPTQSTAETLLGVPLSAPGGDTAPATVSSSPPTLASAPSVSTTPQPGGGIALDVNGRLPASVGQTITGYQFAYQEIVSSVAISATTEATANTILTLPAVVMDGQTRVWIEFFTPFADNGAAGSVIYLVLYEDGNSIGLMGGVYDTVSESSISLLLKRNKIPSAGQHVYSIRGYKNAGAGQQIGAGPGGSGQQMPAYGMIYRF
jgi:hypothetical protein